jgi:hypothetical protein
MQALTKPLSRDTDIPAMYGHTVESRFMRYTRRCHERFTPATVDVCTKPKQRRKPGTCQILVCPAGIHRMAVFESVPKPYRPAGGFTNNQPYDEKESQTKSKLKDGGQKRCAFGLLTLWQNREKFSFSI